MNAYYIQDRLEAQSWTRHYQQIAREEKEAEDAHRQQDIMAISLSSCRN
ncbi:host-nuclease inhibitor protein Gam [Escherichia albertii KF1]|nr:host-nuclease inhibitor protein Gam [Escherichia albertii KF1]